MSNKKTVLITGGAGFIGANLIRTLLRTTSNTIHTIIAPQSNLWRLGDILNDVIIHEVDLADLNRIQTTITSIKPNFIYHLAAFGGMPNEQDQKIVYDVNFYGTMQLLNACKKVGFDCFINTGSSSEYGIKSSPMHEGMVLEPVSDYGVAKAAATQYCLKEALVNKLPIYTIRPFSVYGDYEMPTRLIPTIIVNALTDKPINLSSPTCVRDYIYIKDMITAYLNLAQQKPNNHYIFNIGTGQQSTITDVVAMMQTLLNKKLNVTWGSSAPRPWEPKQWQANNQQAYSILGWKPVYNLNEGLRSSITWFKEHLSWYLEEKEQHANNKQAASNTTPCTTTPQNRSTSMSA